MLTEQSVINQKIIADEDQVNRGVAQAVSQLKAQTDLMLDLSAYLFSGNADAAHIDTITAKFQAQLDPLLSDILPKLQAIEACGNAADGPANLASMISNYGLNPATFSDRYK